MAESKEVVKKLIGMNLCVGEYEPTMNFFSIQKHACVASQNLDMVATTGPAYDKESVITAVLFSQAATMYAILKIMDDSDYSQSTIETLKEGVKLIIEHVEKNDEEE